MEAVAPYTTELSTGERWELQSFESIIERGLSTFVDVGTALARIRDGRLYRATHPTFEDYLRERWQLSRPRAYQLIAAADVHAHLSTVVDNPPTNEAQTRVLASVPAEQRVQVWTLATNGNGTASASKIEQAKRELLPPVLPSSVPQVATPAPDKLAVHYSSESPEWYTPPEIIAPVLAFFDEIDLDPCSNSRTHPNVPAREVFTKDDDGLRQHWHGRVFLNPPYARGIIDLWIEKLLIEYQARRVEQAIALVPARTETEWFSGLYRFPLLFISGRLHFLSPDGEKSAAPFPSVLALIGDDVDGFARWFDHLGPIVREYRV